jgi:hypothetical protein
VSDEERAILEPALADAKRGENLIDADSLDLLAHSSFAVVADGGPP